jgi:hypothetical protein
VALGGKETVNKPESKEAAERASGSLHRRGYASPCFDVFPNGTSHMMWMERNCDQCVKRYDEAKHTKGRSECDIENAIALASATDGSLLHSGHTPMNKADAIAKRLNWDGESYLTHDCPERVL